MSLLDDLSEAAEESAAGCKLCTILDAFPDDEASDINAFLKLKRGDVWKISAEKGVAILKDHGYIIGATTLRRHRNQDHSTPSSS